MKENFCDEPEIVFSHSRMQSFAIENSRLRKFDAGDCYFRNDVFDCQEDMNDSEDHDDIFSHLIGRGQNSEDEDQVQMEADIQEPKFEILVGNTQSELEFFFGEIDSSSSDKVLKAISNRHELVWLVNAKAAGLPYGPGSFDVESDLLASFPEDIRHGNSLHVVSHAMATEQMPEELSRALEADAAICFSLNESAAEFGDNLKLIIGWFITSSSLKFQLENGASFLIQNLFLRIKFILIQDKANTGNWFLFNNPTHPLSWKELGFPKQLKRS